MTYKDFFKLTDTPFRLTPDVDYFFSSQGHGAALETLFYSIRSGEGFVQITGQPGVGKTLLIRHLLNQLHGEVKTALILHPRLGAEDLLKVILEDLGIQADVNANNTKEGLLKFFRKHLLDTGQKGCTTVVIIDEAQEIPNDTLEELRLLSNLETEKKKLLSIILVGQTELEEKLNHRSLRQLYQRITIRYRIEPFTRKETDEYIRHRLSIAGAAGNVYFSNSVLHAIHKKSVGIPRRINILCERTLMAACVEGQQTLKKRHVKRAVTSYLGTAPLSNTRRYPIGMAILLLAVFLAAGTWYLFFSEYSKPFISAKGPLIASEKQSVTDGAENDKKSSGPGAFALSPSSSKPVSFAPGTDLKFEHPPVERLPENWRCLVLDRQNDQGQMWQGKGKTVVPVQSFEIQDIPLDDGIYLLGQGRDNIPFILSHHGFLPGQRNPGLAERLWSQFGTHEKLPIIPLIIYPGKRDGNRIQDGGAAKHIRTVVDGWADAWRSLDIDLYIQYYGPTHIHYLSAEQKSKMISRAEYYRKKGGLFRRTGSLTLQISEPVCIINPASPNTAMAFFYQHYASARYIDEGIKVLFLRQMIEFNDTAPAWKIEGHFWMPMPSVKKKDS